MRIELFTRPNCPLCDEARRLVERVCGEQMWVETNVDDDADLRAAYGEFVPVVEVDGEQVGQWRIEEARLREALGQKERATRWRFRRRAAR